MDLLEFSGKFQITFISRRCCRVACGIQRGITCLCKVFFYLHLEFFLENLGAISDEHDERFYQDIQAIKESYQGV